MLAFVGTVVLRLASGKVLLRDGDGVLGTHTPHRRLPERHEEAMAMAHSPRRRPGV
jgi:hypothetical protein